MSSPLLVALWIAIITGETAPAAPWVVVQTSVNPAFGLSRQAAHVAHQAAGSGKRVLVYFHADWCGPCRVVQKVFTREANRGLFEKWVLLPVNVDEIPGGPALGVAFDSVPFFIKLDADGKVAGTLSAGAIPGAGGAREVDAAFRNFLRT